MLQLMTPVFVMATIVLVGFFITKKMDISIQTRKFLSFTVINFALPAVIANSIFQTPLDREMWNNFAVIYIFGLILSSIGMAAGYFAAKSMGYDSSSRRQLAILAGCGNTGFIGIPVAYMIFGSTIGVYAAIYDASTMTLVFTVGVLLLKGERFSFKQLHSLVNAPFITLFVSLLIVSTGVEIPMYFTELAATLAGISAPLAMIYLGLLIPTIPSSSYKAVRDAYKRFIGAAVFIKVLLLPAMAFTALLFLPIEGELAYIIVIQASMPTFILAIVLFERYLGDGSQNLGITAILLSSLLSLLVLPLAIFLGTTYL